MVGPQPPLPADHTGVILGKKEEEEHPMNQTQLVRTAHIANCIGTVTLPEHNQLWWPETGCNLCLLLEY